MNTVVLYNLIPVFSSDVVIKKRSVQKRETKYENTKNSDFLNIYRKNTTYLQLLLYWLTMGRLNFTIFRDCLFYFIFTNYIWHRVNKILILLSATSFYFSLWFCWLETSFVLFLLSCLKFSLLVYFIRIWHTNKGTSGWIQCPLTWSLQIIAERRFISHLYKCGIRRPKQHSPF